MAHSNHLLIFTEQFEKFCRKSIEINILQLKGDSQGPILQLRDFPMVQGKNQLFPGEGGLGRIVDRNKKH